MGRLATDIKNNDEILKQKNFNPKIEQERIDEVKRLDENIHALRGKLEEVQTGNTANLNVNFNSPYPDFDRKLVRGRILKLFQIREDKYA